MRTYSDALIEKSGFSLVEVWSVDATGVDVLVGYAILDSDGNEAFFFMAYDDALEEFLKLTDDNEPPPGLGM